MTIGVVYEREDGVIIKSIAIPNFRISPWYQPYYVGGVPLADLEHRLIWKGSPRDPAFEEAFREAAKRSKRK